MKGDDPMLARVVLVTHPDKAAAQKMATTLVEEKLAACVTVIPGVTSVYRWQGAVVESAEVQLLIKTREGVIGPLKHMIADLHPQEVPELLVLSTDGGSGKYIAWIGEETEERPH